MITGLTDGELAAMAHYQIEQRSTVRQVLVCEELARRGVDFTLLKQHMKAMAAGDWRRKEQRRTKGETK
jgi:hypothetical protein